MFQMRTPDYAKRRCVAEMVHAVLHPRNPAREQLRAALWRLRPNHKGVTRIATTALDQSDGSQSLKLFPAVRPIPLPAAVLRHSGSVTTPQS